LVVKDRGLVVKVVATIVTSGGSLPQSQSITVSWTVVDPSTRQQSGQEDKGGEGKVIIYILHAWY